MERRLAAILAADVAGFSTLAGRDEGHAISALKGHLSALDPVIGQHRGRIVKSTGAGFLAEFVSVVDAVGCTALMLPSPASSILPSTRSASVTSRTSPDQFISMCLRRRRRRQSAKGQPRRCLTSPR